MRAAAVAAGRGGAVGDDALAGATLGTRAPLGGLSAAQRAALSDLLRVRAAVAALAAKAEEERTTRFLYAASRGRLAALRYAVRERAAALPFASFLVSFPSFLLSSPSFLLSSPSFLLSSPSFLLSFPLFSSHFLLSSLPPPKKKKKILIETRNALAEGTAPDASDYDGRTALMLACVGNHLSVVETLLAAGADPKLRDNLGSCALSEACVYGADAIIDRLVSAGARLADSSVRGGAGTTMNSAAGGNGSGNGRDSSRMRVRLGTAEVAEASRLCSAVYSCDLPLLRRYLRVKSFADAADYEGRRALHIAAAEGNLAVVRVLADEAGADLGVRDRWGFTPLDEALRVGAGPVVEFLRERGAPSARREGPAAAAGAAER